MVELVEGSATMRVTHTKEARMRGDGSCVLRRARSTCLRPGPCLPLALGILTLAGKLLFRKCENIEPGRVPFQPESQFLRLGEGCL